MGLMILDFCTMGIFAWLINFNMNKFYYRLGIASSWFIFLNIIIFLVMFMFSILNIDEVDALLLFYGILLSGCVALPFASSSCFLFPGSGIVFLIIVFFGGTLFFTRNSDVMSLKAKLASVGKVILIFVIFCLLALLLVWGLNNLFFNV